MREFVKLTNVITSGNLVAGFLALLAAQRNLLLAAAALVLLAASLDFLDGVVARRLDGEGQFGSTLDSLADLVSFGVVPALMQYLGPLHSLSVFGVVTCLGFFLCGAWRLARFPLTKTPRCFIGVPIPAAGVLVALLAVWGPAPLLALLVTAALSVLMVSSLSFPTFSSSVRAATSISRQFSNRRPPHS